MNRKVLVIAVALMAIAMLATPMVGVVQAGKGQEKQYFKLYMEGISVGPPDRVWTSDDLTHIRGAGWVVTGDFEVTIGATTIYPVAYGGSLDVNLNTKTHESTAKITETITFADGSTLEILSIDQLHNYPTPAWYGTGTFVGHGTGALEGVEVEGTVSSGPIIFGVQMYVTREGTVMDWPT